MKRRITHDMMGYNIAEPLDFEAFLQVLDAGIASEKQISELHVRCSWELMKAAKEARAPHPRAVTELAKVFERVQFEGTTWDDAFHWPYRPTIEQPGNWLKYQSKFDIAWLVAEKNQAGTPLEDCFDEVGEDVGKSSGRVRQIYYEVKEAWDY